MRKDSLHKSEAKWLQIGYPKSGNFWLYRILKSIAYHAGLERKSFIQSQPIYSIAREWKLSFEHEAEIDIMDVEKNQFFYTISSIFRMPIQDLDAYLASCSHVWMHAPWGPLVEGLLKKFTKVVYIVRDPRDVAVSLSHFVFTPYGAKTGFLPSSCPSLFLKENFSTILESWANHVSAYLKQRELLNIHFVVYERFLNNFQGELQRLLEYLGISLELEAKKAIQKQTEFLQMKEGSPLHLRKGQWGQWRKDLSKSQHRFAERFIGDLLSIFQYSRLGEECVDSNSKNLSPIFLNQRNSTIINQIIPKIERRILIRKFFRLTKNFGKNRGFSRATL